MKIIDIKEKQKEKEIELALQLYRDLKKLYLQDNDFENSHYGSCVQYFFEEWEQIGHLKNSVKIPFMEKLKEENEK